MLSSIRRLNSARLVHRLYTSPCGFEARRCLSRWTFSQRNVVARPSGGITFKARQQLRFSSTNPVSQIPTKVEPNYLPVTCPGCGAYTQWVTPGEAGYFDLRRQPVKEYIRHCQRDKTPAASETIETLEEDGSEGENNATEPLNTDSKPTLVNSEIEAESGAAHPESSSAESLAPEENQTESALGNETKSGNEKEEKKEKKVKQKGKEMNGEPEQSGTVSKPAPVCDRCNQLVNHTKGESIPYPPLSYIHDLIDESPFRNNNIYHVIDAADFPLSVIPNLERELPLASLRSKNRRSMPTQYSSGGKLAVLNFIITRSDLLGRNKEIVDTYMTPMVSMLRETLGSKGSKVRLGNVHMVSANRGWWTKEVKEKIWEHGGGVWLVGKTNVGKSALMASIFPKTAPAGATRFEPSKGGTIVGRSNKEAEKKPENNDEISEDGLLPPLREVTKYPDFPIHSACAGTTASPIRLPFDNHRGELIDLPGLHRTGLDNYVRPEFQQEIVMQRLIKAKPLSLGPSKSLLLGGLIRISTITDHVFMTMPFVNLETHMTSTVKAQEKYQGNANIPIKDVSSDNIHESMKSAGIFELKWDVSDRYDSSGKRIRRGVELFKVFGAEILIEGVGWVELKTQVRTKGLVSGEYPKVEVFSPEGKFVGSRMPLCAWADISKPKPKKGIYRDMFKYKPPPPQQRWLGR